MSEIDHRARLFLNFLCGVEETARPAQMAGLAQRISTNFTHGRLSGETIIVRAFRTVCEMLTDRGYALQSSCNDSSDVMERIKQRESVVSASASDGRSCFVFFDSDDKVSIKFIRTICEAHPDAFLMVVSPDGPTSFAKKEVNDPWGERIQFFTFKELSRNVSRHELVPTHSLMTADECESLQRTYKLNLAQLPPLLVHDPVRRYYGYKRGDVIRILRRGVGQEVVPFYRIVQISA